MRLAYTLAAALLLTACPASQSAPGTDSGTGPTIDGGGETTDGGTTPEVDGGSACTAIPTCTITIKYAGAGTKVILHGDFAPDGWTTGVTMTKNGAAFESTLPVQDGQVVLYRFEVDGTWMADPANPASSPNGYGETNSVVRVDCDHCPARPLFDWHDAVLYFVMIDRFMDGDASNNHPLGLERPADYQGGDIAGLTQKIDEGYFEQLGINALWVTSPLDGADMSGIGADGHQYSAYHGYWPKDLEKVESRVGTLAELQHMVDEAHAHKLQVIIDYAMNHVHAESPVYAQHPDWFWPNSNGRGGDCVCGGGCSWDDAVERKRCWFTNYLPDFNFTNGDARRWSVNNALTWAKTLGIDGFRLDAVKHIEDSWLTDLRGRLIGEVQNPRPFYLVGETYTGDQGLIKYYVNPGTMLDGQFDFPLRAQILEKILRRAGSMADLGSFLDSDLTYYGAGAIMSTFIGNHDVPRSIHYAEDTPLFGDWDDGKGRAWNNPPQLPGSRSPFERMAVAYTLLLTTPGVPMIYYGDEIGMPGGGDPDNRRFMQWTGYSADQTFLKDRLAVLTRLRAAHPALRRGTRTTLGSGANTLTYKMSTSGDTVYVVLNRGDTAAVATGLPSLGFHDLVSGQMMTSPVMVPARTGLVLVTP